MAAAGRGVLRREERDVPWTFRGVIEQANVRLYPQMNTNHTPSVPGGSDRALPAGFLSAPELLEALWPNPVTRPSLRWLRSLQARRAVPFLKVGHKVLFEAERVRAALRRFEIKPVSLA
jgi:hypothetical protein